MDWSGKLLKTYASASQVTSALAVSDTSLYVIANNETDYPPPYTGVHNLDVATGKTRWVKQIPLAAAAPMARNGMMANCGSSPIG